MKVEFLKRFSKNTEISKLMKNPSIGSRVVPCGRTDRQTDKQTDMAKLVVTFRNLWGTRLGEKRQISGKGSIQYSVKK